MADFLLLFLLAICLFTDLKKRKIYNKVLVPALLLGIILNVFNYGVFGLIFSLKGFFTGLLFLILPYTWGGIGAGDVKLLATIGSIKGPTFVLYAGLYMGIAGGVLAILILIYQKRLFVTVKDLLTGFIILFATRFKVANFGNKNANNMFPYGVAITMGALAAYIVGVT
ncbi:MAG: A24 family peptidase [Peptococcales bacterium]|jgi:prepilin peptidase CpaA